MSKDPSTTTAQPSSFSRRGLLGAAAGIGLAGALAPDWAAANEAEERPFVPRSRGRLAEQPNLPVILADDLGWADLSSYGSPHISTPNLDRLALSGVRFTQGYSASSVCSPTRFGLYTGRYPGRLRGGLPEPIAQRNELDGIPLDHPTLASLIKGVGYETALIGKWHCGFLPAFSPTRVGWDSFFGNFSGAVDYFSKVSGDGIYDLYEGEVEYDDVRYYTHVLTERAVEFVGHRHDRPWLLNLNFTSPHWPWAGPGDRAVSDDLTERTRAGDARALFHLDGGSLDKYREMVEDLDRSIGRVLTALDRSGQRRDTVVFFASDNGGERFSYYWPFSGGKGNVLEGGIRVSTILSWPGVLESKRVNHHPVVTQDWTATLLELAGAEPDPAYPLDGESFVGQLFRGQQAPEHDLVWRMRGSRALRRGNLKYFEGSDGVPKLFDLSVDERKQADLSRARPADVAALKAAWDAVNAELLPY